MVAEKALFAKSDAFLNIPAGGECPSLEDRAHRFPLWKELELRELNDISSLFEGCICIAADLFSAGQPVPAEYLAEWMRFFLKQPAQPLGFRARGAFAARIRLTHKAVTRAHNKTDLHCVFLPMLGVEPLVVTLDRFEQVASRLGEVT